MARLSLGIRVPPPGILAAWLVSLGTPAMMLASCLVTSTADLKPRPQTPPFLVARNTNPDPRNMFVVDYPTEGAKIDFEAQVRSEDFDTSEVKTRLYVDYGFKAPGFDFWRDYSTGAALKPGQLDNTTRKAKVSFTNKANLEGCHTFTMVATHAIDEQTQCPVNESDSSSLTWHVYFCHLGESPCPQFTDPNDTCTIQGEDPQYCPAHAGPDGEGGSP